MALGFALAGPAIIDAMTTTPEVREAARLYLPWVIAAPILGIAAWMFDGIFIGATRTREMLITSALSAASFALAVWALWSYGNHGLWAALMVLNIMRGLSMAALYPRISRSIEAP